ncbi:hypothetical protein D7S89_14885 [Trinickia fusca]|uniref:Uncharacterized protein n=2 Tax=Trinickia fusca TaxID=2419777 RepID=A0A494XDB7_9BURK|nr:hypothetical protein D7S89_14885 [Trinickia fusca]
MSRRHVVPEDFPRELAPGVVPGAQPKVLVREKDGRYYTGLADDELLTRYEVCEDFARQLSAYASRKMCQFGWSFSDAFSKVERSVNRKVTAGEWNFSPAEIAWVMKRTRALLLVAENGAGGRNANC